jgi:hypothetical protein
MSEPKGDVNVDGNLDLNISVDGGGQIATIVVSVLISVIVILLIIFFSCKRGCKCCDNLCCGGKCHTSDTEKEVIEQNKKLQNDMKTMNANLRSLQVLSTPYWTKNRKSFVLRLIRPYYQFLFILFIKGQLAQNPNMAFNTTNVPYGTKMINQTPHMNQPFPAVNYPQNQPRPRGYNPHINHINNPNQLSIQYPNQPLTGSSVPPSPKVNRSNQNRDKRAQSEEPFLLAEPKNFTHCGCDRTWTDRSTKKSKDSISRPS